MVRARVEVTLIGLLLSVSLALSGCSPAPPLIPPDVVELVAEEGRMRSYDVAWQNTRMLNDAIARDAVDTVGQEIVLLTARLHRLETGRAGSLADRSTEQTVNDFLEEAGTRSPADNRQVLVSSAKALQEAFDLGDFALAKKYALEVFALITHSDSLLEE